MSLTAVAVDPTDNAGGRVVFNNLAPFGPFSIPGGLLHFVWSSTANTLLACQSVDGGNTWTVLDPLNSPTAPTAAIPGYVDAVANTVVFIAGDGANSVVINTFSLATLTWQTPFTGTNKPTDVNESHMFGFFQRSDDTRVLLYTSTHLDSGVHTLHAVVLSAANVWGGTFIVTSNVPLGIPPVGVVVAVLDAADTLHVFFAFGAFPWSQCYQAILPTNALGSFSTLINNPLNSGVYFGVPVIVGANIIAPTVQASDGSPGSVWVGTPLASPAWTESAGIFPNANASGLTSSRLPFCRYDGTNLTCLKVMDGPGAALQNIISISQASDPNNPLGTWDDVVFWQALPADPIYEQIFGSPQIGSGGMVCAGCLTALIAYVFVAPPPPPLRIVSGSPGGGGAPPKRCCPTLLAGNASWKRAKRILEMYAPLCGSKHVMAGYSIPAPATNAQTLILQYKVPNGFRFRLTGLLLGCNCSAWTPGDGNVVFSLSLNKPVGSTASQGAPIQGFGNITVPLGSFEHGPWPIPEDERSLCESRDVVYVSVVSNPLVIAPGLPNVFTAMLVGDIWPLTPEAERAML
jgi:hypothetical protein